MRPSPRWRRHPPAALWARAGPRPAAAPDAVVCALSLVLTVAAAAGWARVFAGSHWAYPVMLTAAVATLAAFAARRTGLGPVWSALAGLVATWVTAAETVFPGSMQAGFPLLKAAAQARSAVELASQKIPLLKAPVPAWPGLVLGAAWGAGLCATVADYALVAKRSLAGLVPALVMFVGCCALGTASGRLWAVAALTAAMVALSLAHQATLGRAEAPLLPLRRPAAAPGRPAAGVAAPAAPARAGGRRAHGPGPDALLPALRGVSVAAAALGAAVAVVPALGPDGHGPAGWLRHLAQPVRLTPDPMVSMSGDLHEQYPLPAFVVHSGAGSYWRLTSVSHFSGTAWTSSGQYQPVDGALPGVQRQPGALQVTEEFAIQDLGSPWLPTGFRPEQVKGATDVSWDPTSSSLLSAAPTANGQRYTVTAEQNLATLNPVSLNSAGPLTNADLTEFAADLQLPARLPTEIGALARHIVGHARTEYDKALALQDYFHRAPFVYTLDPPPPPKGQNALVNFLFSSHAGFCQQYAGAFGALARLVGLPTRIAVGFTTGKTVGPGTWEVVATDAHAWPEVWFPHTGWVPFEPTPGFSIPQATRYTGPAGLRGGPTGPGATRSVRVPASTPAGSTVTPGPRPGPSAGPGRPPNSGSPGKGRTRPARAHGPHFSVTLVALLATGAAATGLLGWAGLLALARSWRRRRRHTRLARALGTGRSGAPGRLGVTSPGAHPAAAEILAIWEDLSEVLSGWGIGRYLCETPAEWAARLGPGLNAAGGAGPGLATRVVLLAAAVDAAVFDPAHDPGASPAAVRGAARAVRAWARQAAGRRRRFAHLVVPSALRRARRPPAPA